jgi:regulator of replication initiation timing
MSAETTETCNNCRQSKPKTLGVGPSPGVEAAMRKTDAELRDQLAAGYGRTPTKENLAPGRTVKLAPDVVDVSHCADCGKDAKHVVVECNVVRCMECNEQHKARMVRERGKTMNDGTMPTQKQNLTQQLNGLRAENAGLRAENERLHAKVVEAETRYKELADVWNAIQAGASDNGKMRQLMRDPKHVALLGQEFALARRLATKLLRFIDTPDTDEEV